MLFRYVMYMLMWTYMVWWMWIIRQREHVRIGYSWVTRTRCS